MLDSKGVITSDRPNLTESKKFFATDRRDVHTLEEAIKGADVFLGLSKGNVLTQDMVRSMADHPIVFALANPTPEISYEDAMASRPDVLMSTGRSDLSLIHIYGIVPHESSSLFHVLHHAVSRK